MHVVTPPSNNVPEPNEEAGILSLILVQLEKLTEVLIKHTGELPDGDDDA